MAVLSALREHQAPISITDLIAQLGSDFAERSVRRWLADEGKVLKTGHKRGTRYQIVSFEFNSESLDAINYIKQPIFERATIRYQNDWLESYQPNTTFYLSENTRAEMSSQGRRMSDEDRAGTYAHKILNRMLIDLSFNSSRLEGNTYSLLDT